MIIPQVPNNNPTDLNKGSQALSHPKSTPKKDPSDFPLKNLSAK